MAKIKAVEKQINEVRDYIWFSASEGMFSREFATSLYPSYIFEYFRKEGFKVETKNNNTTIISWE